MKFEDSELRIDTYSSSTENVVTITHLCTGIVVRCSDYNSVFRNRIKALKTLEEKLILNDADKYEKQILEDNKK